MANQFEKLPDEILMVIVKMATKECRMGRLESHELLTSPIAQTSKRFRRLVGDKSLWGRIKIRDFDETIDFLNIGVKDIFVESGTQMTRYDIQALADTCPKLTGLWYPSISSWPSLGTPLNSLRYLAITLDSNGIFDGIELHRSVPNLKYLHIRVNAALKGHPITLPDMGGCKKLRMIMLGNGHEFWVPEGVASPFPTELRKLQSESLFDTPATIKANQFIEMRCNNLKILNVNFGAVLSWED